MKLVVGLGNPGPEYADTRHNVGWPVLDAVARELGASDFRLDKKFRAELAEARFVGDKVLLIKPQTYMNLSGEAVGAIMRFNKLQPKDVLIVYDDLAIPLGTVRLRADGSAGGHNGIKSLIAHLNGQVFDRVRVGIGPQPPGVKSEQFVLAKWTPTERKLLPEAVALGAEATLAVMRMGLERAGTAYNGRKPAGEEVREPAPPKPEP